MYSASDLASPHTHTLPTGLGTCECVCPPGVLIGPSWESDTNHQLWSQPQLFASAQDISRCSSGVPPHYWVLVEFLPCGIPLGQALSDGPFSGAHVGAPAGPWNHNRPFPVPGLGPALGPPQTKLCPHQNYPTPDPQLLPWGVFNPPFRTCLPLLSPWLAFQPTWNTLVFFVLTLDKGDSHPHVYFHFQTQDNYPQRCFWKEKTEDEFWS